MMRFKLWMEGEYGQSAAGVVPPVFTDQPKPQVGTDRKFAVKGVRDRYTQSDIKQQLPPKYRRKPLGY